MSIFEAIISWDISILWAIQSIKCAFLDVAMAFFSYAGEKGAIWIVLSIILLAIKKTRTAGIAVLCAMAIGLLLGEFGIKILVCRPRPFVTFPELPMNIVKPSGYSFPSGHTTSSFAATTVISIRYKKFATPALLLAALIGFSRLYNCVHYPTDVICGALLGVIIAVITCVLFKKFDLDNRINKKLIRKKVM